MSLEVTLTEPAGPKCPHCGHSTPGYTWSADITHNLAPMAKEAGIYEPLWMANETGLIEAWMFGVHLHPALKRMKADPERFKKLNPENGWGTYEGFVEWIERLLEVCAEHPNAVVSTHR